LPRRQSRALAHRKGGNYCTTGWFGVVRLAGMIYIGDM